MMAPKKNVHTTLRLPQDLHDALRAHAYLVNSSFNNEVNIAIYEYLKNHVPSDPDEAMTKALERDKGFHLAALKRVEEM